MVRHRSAPGRRAFPPHRTSPGRVTAAVIATAAPVLLAVLVLLPDRLGLDRRLPFAVLAALRPALTVAVAALVVVALVVLLARRRRVTRRWPALALAGVTVVVALAAAMVIPRAVPAPDPPPGGTPLTVVELNAFQGLANVNVLAALVRREKADLVVVPEAGDPFRRAIAARLREYRTWTNVAPGTPDVRGITLLASPRAGAVTARVLTDAPGTPDDTRYPWAEVTGGILGPVRFGAVHVVSVVPEWIAYWPGELGALQRWCGPGAGPAIVVGDLNATPDHSAFRAGTAGCTDAATDRGRSLEATWIASSPRWLGAQIDHVLTTDGAGGAGGPVARDLSVVDVPGSDHRALVVHLRLP